MLQNVDPLRVLLVAARYFPYIGGLETHVYEVGRRLAREHMEVTILTTDVSGRLPATEETEGMKVVRVRAWPENRDYYFAPDIYRVITRGSWDIIHCQGYHNLVPPLAMLAALRVHIPFVLSFHSGGDVSSVRKALRGVQRTMLRPLLLQAQKLIAVSEYEFRFFRTHLRLPSERFVVIPNGAHLAEVTKAVVDMPARASTSPTVVSFGRLEQYKGHQRVIAALPTLLEYFPDARVRIVGTGPYESALRKIATKLGVEERVEIRAISPEDRGGMAALLAHADLVTLLSEYEAHPISVMEALAFQRPVLVAATSGLQELADRGLACAVPLTSSPEEVAKAMVRQLNRPLIPAHVSLPTWDACAISLLALYQTIARRLPCVS